MGEAEQRHSNDSSILFTSYLNLGLICFHPSAPNKLALISPLVAYTDDIVSADKLQYYTKNVLFKRISSITISPELPHTAHFNLLLVNRSGSMVALVGSRMLFVVEMDEDLWKRTCALEPDSAEHIKPDFFARCDLLHMTLFLRKYPPLVIKAEWFDPPDDAKHIFDRAGMFVPNGILALLYSDNVIRLYDVASTLDRPLAQLDFNHLLPDRTPSESSDDFSDTMIESKDLRSNLGFITQLVSFDFGQIFYTIAPTSSDQLMVIGSLIALDSNGQLYMAFFAVNNNSRKTAVEMDAPILGPLSCHFPCVQPSMFARLLCSGQDLLHIRHANSQSLSIWALISEDNLLAHLVLARQQQEEASQFLPFEMFATSTDLDKFCSVDFQMFSLEILEIGQSPPNTDILLSDFQRRNNNVPQQKQSRRALRLQNEPKLALHDYAAYFLICSRERGRSEIFWLDLSSILSNLISNSANNQKSFVQPSSSFSSSPPVGQSRVQQLMLMMPAQGTTTRKARESVFASSSFISSFACLQLRSLTQEGRPDCHFQLLAALQTNEFVNSAGGKQKKEEGDAPSASKQHSFLATIISRPLSASSSLPFLDFVSSPLSHQKPQIPLTAEESSNFADQMRQLLSQPDKSGFASSLPLMKIGEQRDGDGQPAFEQRAAQLLILHDAIRNVLLNGGLPARGKAIDLTLQRAQSLLVNFQVVEQCQENAQRQLSTIFRQIIELKGEIQRRRTRMWNLEERIKRISYSFQPLLFPASAVENEAVQKFKSIQQKLTLQFAEMAKLHQRAVEQRQSICQSAAEGSSPSATGFGGGSGKGQVPAHMFMLLKNNRNCSKLKESLNELSSTRLPLTKS